MVGHEGLDSISQVARQIQLQKNTSIFEPKENIYKFSSFEEVTKLPPAPKQDLVVCLNFQGRLCRSFDQSCR